VFPKSELNLCMYSSNTNALRNRSSLSLYEVLLPGYWRQHECHCRCSARKHADTSTQTQCKQIIHMHQHSIQALTILKSGAINVAMS